jgi:hypothetical protein
MVDVLGGIGCCGREWKSGWIDSAHAHHAPVEGVLFVLFNSEERIFSHVVPLQHILYVEDLQLYVEMVQFPRAF